MKKFLLISSIIFLAVISNLNAQVFRNRQKAMEKLDQLEKVKLIEALDMDEETTLKFFSRRKEFKERRDKMMKQIDDLTEKMAYDVESGNIDPKDPSYSKMLEDHFKLERDFFKLREDFVLSLKDILNEEQIIKYVVFERKFREEIQDLIFKFRKQNQQNR
jgi:hypothetical protein